MLTLDKDAMEKMATYQLLLNELPVPDRKRYGANLTDLAKCKFFDISKNLVVLKGNENNLKKAIKQLICDARLEKDFARSLQIGPKPTFD